MVNKKTIKYSIYALLILLLAVLQFTPHFLPKILGNSPIYLLPAVITIAMFEGESAGAGYAVFAGILWDVQTGFAFGANALFLLLIGVAVGLLIQLLFRNTVVTAIIFTAIACSIQSLFTWFFIDYLRGEQNFIFCFLYILLPTVLYTLLFSAPIYLLVKRINSKFQAEEN